MPRRRMIDPGFWDDPDIGRLQPLDRLLALAAISLADDWGNLLADEAYLKKTVFGYDAISFDDVAAMRDRVFATCRNWKRYEVDGQVYLHLENWEKHQHLRYRAAPTWPLAPGQVAEKTGWQDDKVADEPPQDCGNIAAGLPQDCGIGKVKQEQAKQEQGRQEQASKPAAAGVAFALQACGVSRAVAAELAADPWVDTARIQAAWSAVKARGGVKNPVGLLVTMLRGHDQARASPEELSKFSRYAACPGCHNWLPPDQLCRDCGMCQGCCKCKGEGDDG